MSATLPPPAPDDETEPPEPPRLRALRRLVTLLTVTLIVGMASVAGVLVWRLATLASGPAPSAPPLAGAPVAAPALALPAEGEPTALGASRAELFVILRAPDGAETLLTYDRATGALLSETPVTRAPR